MALTDIQIKRAKPQDKPYTLNDGQGLSLLINPDGSKGWRFRFRFAEKARLMSFGSYGLVSLAEAREKREIARKQVANGIDPVEERKPRNWPNNSPLKTHSNPYVVNGTLIKQIAGRWPNAKKSLRNLIAKRGALEKTRKVRQRCGEVYRYTMITGRAEYNSAPVLSIALAVPKQKHHPFLSAEELPYFIRDLEACTGSIITKNATKTVMLTGVQTQEMRFAAWDEVDLEKGIWEIPEERMKMRRPHIVPLSTQVVDLFKQLNPITGHYPYIFIGRNNRNNPISKESMSKIIELHGYKGVLQAMDLDIRCRQ